MPRVGAVNRKWKYMEARAAFRLANPVKNRFFNRVKWTAMMQKVIQGDVRVDFPPVVGREVDTSQIGMLDKSHQASLWHIRSNARPVAPATDVRSNLPFRITPEVGLPHFV